MTNSIQTQIDRNRKLLLNLPAHITFSRVWCPEALCFVTRPSWTVLDNGMTVTPSIHEAV